MVYSLLPALFYSCFKLSKDEGLQNVETLICCPEQHFSHNAINCSRIDGSFLNTIYPNGFAANSNEKLRPIAYIIFPLPTIVLMITFVTFIAAYILTWFVELWVLSLSSCAAKAGTW